jgi:hypothetical protein
VKSKKGYWIGGGLIVLGGILAALWLVISFVRLDDQIDGFERVPVPGEQTVRLEAGKYTVYYEGFTARQLFPTPEELTIADAESGPAPARHRRDDRDRRAAGLRRRDHARGHRDPAQPRISPGTHGLYLTGSSFGRE